MENSPNYTSDSFIPIPDSSNDVSSSNGKRSTKFDPGDFKKSKHVVSQNSNNSFVCPWKKSQTYSCGILGLHEEINDFFDMMSPTSEETEIRLKVLEHITKLIHSLWPLADVQVFGSFRTGLYLPSSDIDIVVTGKWKNVPLSTLSEAFQNSGIKKDDITIIPHASVPIIRMLHSPSRIRVDISFNKENGVKTAKFVKKLIKEYPPLPKLILVLKQFLIHRGLNEVYSGGMSSYCLTLLLVSFLQGLYKPKGPPVTNLGSLLLEFFELYGINFNYEKVSIHFDCGGNYQPRARDSGSSYLSIEDPLVAGKDIGKGTFLMHLLKVTFQNAFHVLNKAVLDSMVKQRPAHSYLELIFKVEDEVMNSRQWTQENHSYILRSISRLLLRLSESDNEEEESSVMLLRR